jgi:aerobic-type carbon monoxide dehydrogenase small subunit (CoxS/CutS family)
VGSPSADLTVGFTLDGRPVEVADEAGTLLDALRESLGVRSAKDGCSPQGQCGCCTVLVDGAPRVACVTPVRRVAGRSVTTAEGLPRESADRLVDAFVAHAASQCGFCTPGILCRLSSLGLAPTEAQVERALLAHLCRCTGWRTILAAAQDQAGARAAPRRVREQAGRRAALEGGTAQQTGPDAVLGHGGFADDAAPPGCLVAVPDPLGGWAVGETLSEARAASGKIQGRRSGQELRYPVAVPAGDWDFVLQTTWVEPAYLEPDASWCVPGGQPASPTANGGAFGGKVASIAPAAARELANRYGRPVRVVFSREDVVRLGPKRPPMAAGMRADGTGTIAVMTAPGVVAAIEDAAPLVQVIEVPAVRGPLVSAAIRAAGWAEAAVLVAAAHAVADGCVPAPGAGDAARVSVTGRLGGRADAAVTVDAAGLPQSVEVSVAAGDPLDDAVLHSYVTGAAHMALGWVLSEGIAVADDGTPEDLTIRSFGILRARDTPPIRVCIPAPFGAPLPVSDAAFAAVAAATWIAQGLPGRWPTRRGRTA